MNREQAIDAAQIRANQTGERWYAVRIKHIGEQELEEQYDFEPSNWIAKEAHDRARERDIWVCCDEPTAGTYIYGQQKICVFPISINNSRAYGTRKGGHIGKASAKHR